MPASPAKMKVRIKFRKYGAMKFIGHLDIMRFFQKALRKAGIDICYTKGYSPHPVMSFAAPLGVGLTSDGEYLDIEVYTSKPSKVSIADLNAAMADGLEVTGYVQLDSKAKTAMSQVSAADYGIWYKDGYEVPGPLQDITGCQNSLHGFFALQEHIWITKKTKKSEKAIDLKPLIYDFQILPQQRGYAGHPAFYLSVSTGSTDNLKPELVLEAFYAYLGLEYNPYAMQIHRRDTYYTDSSGEKKPLLQAGQEIKG